MYVICFYWQGDRWQEKGYKPEIGHVNHLQYHINRAGQIDPILPSRYVNNLYYGVDRFAHRPFKFICFTNETLDLDKNIEVRPFPFISKDGVLPRMYMFSREAGLFGHQVLCLDIDIVIVNSLAKLMDYKGLFCSRSNFGDDRIPDGDIMSFRADEESENVFWNPLIEDVPAAEAFAKGRERFWLWKCVQNRDWALWDDIAPDSVVSYKKHKVYRTGRIPKGASIVSCHGVPRPHEIVEKAERGDRVSKWITKYWA